MHDDTQRKNPTLEKEFLITGIRQRGCGSKEASPGSMGACGQVSVQNLEICQFGGGLQEGAWSVKEKPKIRLSSKKGETRPE